MFYEHTGDHPKNTITLIDTPENERTCSNSSKDITSAPRKSKQLCGGFGTQPCTCYYPDHTNVMIFELDTDEVTKNASNLNGAGPATCEDLQYMDHKLPGFYMVQS